MIAAFGAIGGGYPAEFFLEILREVLGVIESDRVSDLGYGELTFFQELGGAFEADVSDEFDRGLTGQE
jgi:hypothetical protein